MDIFIQILLGILGAIRIALLARIILDWVRVFKPGMKPKGIALALITVPYMLTDWAVKPLRKLIKPIPMGASSLDVSVLVLWAATILLQTLLGRVL